MIELRNVTKQFKGNKVLADLSLSIGDGERIALIGSNGAGKTTLIRCLLGEYVHDGVITLDGLVPRQHREEVLGRIGFVPQLPPPLRMPVGQLISFAAATYQASSRDIESICERLGLDARRIASQPFVKLSGGQKQKLLIAIALGRKARLLILDEPAANLDPKARHTFFELLAERAAGVTMLISSHRLDEVAPLVNRVLELDLGRVVLDDRVEEGVALDEVLHCRITVRRADAALAKALGGWNFRADAHGLVWKGVVASPDRLRFLGMLSRYAGLLTDFTLHAHQVAAAEVSNCG